jgi:hypothetical protein
VEIFTIIAQEFSDDLRLKMDFSGLFMRLHYFRNNATASCACSCHDREDTHVALMIESPIGTYTALMIQRTLHPALMIERTRVSIFLEFFVFEKFIENSQIFEKFTINSIKTKRKKITSGFYFGVRK